MSAQPDTPAYEPVRAVWGTSPADLYGITESMVYHYDGTAWSLIDDSGHGQSAVWGFSSRDVYISQESAWFGTIRHYDGVSWTTCMERNYRIHNILGFDTGELFGAGADGCILKFRKTSMVPVNGLLTLLIILTVTGIAVIIYSR